MSEFSENWQGGVRDDTSFISGTVHYKFVILGGGTSAGYAAKTFVECLDPKTNPLGLNLNNIMSGQFNNAKDHHNLVAIISAEPVPPYERPALSKGYMNPPGTRQVRLPNFNTAVGTACPNQSEAWYAQNNIDLLLNLEAIEVDVDKQSIICDRKWDRKLINVTYDKLIIATGARPLFTNMFEKADILGNIFCLRNEFDAASIVKTLENKKGGRVCIIGGGYIGMETAAAFSGWDIEVVMIFPEDNLLSRVFTPEISDWYERYFSQSKHIKIMKNTKVLRFLGENGVVEQAELENGQRLDIDMALIGIGAVLNTDIFEGQLQFAPKNVRGIAVNSFLQTSDPNVYAIGDIAAVPYKRGVKRFEHVDHCRKTAVIAVQNLLIDLNNYFTAYETHDQLKPLKVHHYTPYYYSRLFEFTDTPVIFNYYGSNGDEMEDVQMVQFGDLKSHKITPMGVFWVDKTGRIVGGLLCCAPKSALDELKEIVLTQKRIPSITPAGAVKMFKTLSIHN